MVQLPTVPEADTHDACVVTPIDDYELIDFGAGRKLERWGDYLVESPERLATGLPAENNWNADWIYVTDVGVQSHWEPTCSGLSREWTVVVGDQSCSVCSIRAALSASRVVTFPVPSGFASASRVVTISMISAY